MRSTLFDFQQLDVEDKLGVTWDTRDALLSVGKMGGNGNTALATCSHTSNADIPTFDNLAFAKLECERLALFVG
jgi:hypothetical protein